MFGYSFFAVVGRLFSLAQASGLCRAVTL